jgi:hypothetical protein
MASKQTPQPKMPSSPSTQPNGTKTDLTKLTFNPLTASKHKNKTRRYQRWSGLAPQITKVSPRTTGVKYLPPQKA